MGLFSKNENRKTLLINNKFQTDFLKQFYILQFLIIALTFIILFWQYFPLLQEIRLLNLPQDHPLVIRLEQFHTMTLISGILGLIIFSCIFTVAGLILSNKVAGPLYNLARHLEKIREKHSFEKVRFRRDDYFLELEDEVNNYIDYVAFRLGHKHDNQD